MEKLKLNPLQIQNTLRWLDATQSDSVKQCVFRELGRQCFDANGIASQVEPYRGHPEAYLRRINQEHASPHWESVLPGDDGKSYVLTGVTVDCCVCPYAEAENAPLSLCEHCCSEFQKRFFSILFDCDVKIEITSAYLKGNDRCSTIIHFV